LEQPFSLGAQKLSLMHSQEPPTRLAEQEPPGPQSASIRQLLAVAQLFAPVSELDVRQAHGAWAEQSESLLQSS
jgi:hypothetical protein